MGPPPLRLPEIWKSDDSTVGARQAENGSRTVPRSSVETPSHARWLPLRCANRQQKRRDDRQKSARKSIQNRPQEGPGCTQNRSESGPGKLPGHPMVPKELPGTIRSVLDLPRDRPGCHFETRAEPKNRLKMARVRKMCSRRPFRNRFL